jgi:sulfofructose kinase
LSDASDLATFVGSATLDAIAVVDGYPAANSRTVAHAIRFAGGGPAATAAVTAARLGIRSAFVGAVGDDDEGHRILEGLAADGVDVSGVTVEPGLCSGASVIVVDRSGDTRAISTRPMPEPVVDAGLALIESSSWVHVDHLGWPVVRERLGRLRTDVRPRLSVDGGNPIPGFTVRGVDLYVPTVEALTAAYGVAPVSDLLAAARRDGACSVVATMGADGAVGLSPAGEYVAVPARPVHAISTLGAGDVFHGALVAAMMHDLAFAEAVRYATVAAAHSCREIDGRSGVPSHADVMSELASFGATSD